MAMMNGTEPITAENQHQPDEARAAYLAGVLDEARRQGFSKEAEGRLLVVAIRAWEGR